MRNPAQTEIEQTVRAILTAGGVTTPEETILQLQQLRAQSAEAAVRVDRTVLDVLAAHRRCLNDAQGKIAECRELIERLSEPPWIPGLFHHLVPGGEIPRAVVHTGNHRRVVIAGEDVDLTTLRRGDEVFLNHEQNLIVGISPDGGPRCGETAVFERHLPDGRMVLRWHDDPLVVDVAERIAGTSFKAGDAVRFDRGAWMAFEKIELAPARRYLLDEVPDLPLTAVGGQRANLESLLSVLTVVLVKPELASTYALTGRNSILMVGPPGCGKTLMARVVVSEIARMTGKKCRFAVVKPAEWESPWVGQTQENIRQFFQMLRETGDDGYSVVFLDEVECIGRIRGGAVSQHSDKFLAALLAELDGFADRRNMAIICATNRKDLLDSALYERLSDVEVQVGRPDLRGARAIFNIHLPVTMPFHPNGELARETREELIERAVSKFYSPNGDNELCRLRFRDGKQRVVAARELASGRLFESVCRAARRFAFLREVRGGGAGVRVRDMETAVDDALDRLRTTLTVHNTHAYLADLPQDVDVVSVEPFTRKVKRPAQFINEPA
jgi:proteasome-associated ATPase